jgi:acetyltransferase
VYRTQGGTPGTSGAGCETTTGIRRARSADPDDIRDFFAGLSTRTRYLRFFAPITPTAAMLRYLSGRGPSQVDALIAVRDGVIVGHAMASDQAGPRGELTTDIGVVVADACQRQGVGAALIRALVSRAQARGVAVLTMDVLHGNTDVLGMIMSHWPRARATRTDDGVAMQVRLPQHRPRRAATGPRRTGQRVKAPWPSART